MKKLLIIGTLSISTLAFSAATSTASCGNNWSGQVHISSCAKLKKQCDYLDGTYTTGGGGGKCVASGNANFNSGSRKIRGKYKKF